MLSNTDATASGDDNVIQNVNADGFANLFQPVSDLQVFATWRRITRWVIVNENHAGCRITNSGPKYLARVNQRRVQRAFGDVVLSDWLVLCVERDDVEVFLSRVADQVGELLFAVLDRGH